MKKGIVDFESEVIFDVPTKLNERFRKGSLDIALISSIEFLHGDYEFLAPFGVGSNGPILSVNLYLKEGLSLKQNLRCGVTSESATSVKLLEVIASQFWKTSLKLKPLEDKDECFLLIGNQALENQKLQGFTTIDLAKLWHEYTNKGFVFALFAARKGVDGKKFCEKLEASLNWSEANFDEILNMAVQSSKHDKAFLRKYYQGHVYRLPDLSNLKYFKGLIDDL